MDAYYAKTSKYVPFTKDELVSRLNAAAFEVTEEDEMGHLILVVNDAEVLRPEFDGDSIAFVGYQADDIEAGVRINTILECFGLSCEEGAE